MTSFFKHQQPRRPVGDISDHLWHYNGHSSYKEFDIHERGFGSFLHGHGKYPYDECHDRFSHYIAAGGMRCEAKRAERENKPLIQREMIVRGLIFFTVLWFIFMFVNV